MGIPNYVYVLFFILLYMGVNRCFPRVIKVQRLFIAPLFFILLSIRGMVNLFDIAPTDIFNWLAGCTLGAVLGYLHVSNRQVQADHDRQLIKLPGDWSMLILILSIFLFEFFIHYSIDANWPISANSYFKMSSILILGVIAGMSSGRAANYFYKYKASSSTTLNLD